MAAPTPTTRVSPVTTEIPLKEGYQVLFTLALDPNYALFEVDLQAPIIDGGEPIDITNQFNTKYMTKAPQTLMNLEEFSITGAYDPIIYDQMLGTGSQTQLLNKPTTGTFKFGDGSTIALFGYVRRWEGGNHSPGGGQPRGTMIFVPTQYDDSDNEEQGPVVAETAGT